MAVTDVGLTVSYIAEEGNIWEEHAEPRFKQYTAAVLFPSYRFLNYCNQIRDGFERNCPKRFYVYYTQIDVVSEKLY